MDHSGPDGTDNNHFAYASSDENGSCPTAYPQAVPQISEKFKYNVPAGALIQLSADPTPTSMPGMSTGLLPSYTIHADFWNTWQQAAYVI